MNSLSSGQSGSLVMDRTNFYAEQGGQIFDTGVLTKDDNGQASQDFIMILSS